MMAWLYFHVALIFFALIFQAWATAGWFGAMLLLSAAHLIISEIRKATP